jgi:NMD protein affecting ribosome stability and mRNA decay
MLICPKCGIKSSERDFIEAFCSQCYPANIRVPRQVEVEQCKQCEKIKLAFGWQAAGDKELADYVISKCKGEFEKADYNIGRQEASFEISRSGKKIVIKRYILLTKHERYCKQCERQRGGYYEAILQFRGPENKIKRYAANAEKWLQKHSWVSKIDEQKEGIDIYAGSFDAAFEFVKMLGIKYILTKKLVGRRAGRRIFRSTFAIRFD